MFQCHISLQYHLISTVVHAGILALRTPSVPFMVSSIMTQRTVKPSFSPLCPKLRLLPLKLGQRAHYIRPVHKSEKLHVCLSGHQVVPRSCLFPPSHRFPCCLAPLSQIWGQLVKNSGSYPRPESFNAIFHYSTIK